MTGGRLVTEAACFPAWSIIPFVVMLLSMAILPMAADRLVEQQ